MDAARRLSPHLAFLHRLRSEGGRAEFFVGWFMNGGAGENFGTELSSALAALGLDLALCVYPGPDPEKALASSA